MMLQLDINLLNRIQKILEECKEKTVEGLCKNLHFIPSKECRICYTNDEELGTLVTPCKCKGSLKYIHPECLKAWII